VEKKKDGTSWFWGEGGILPLEKTGFLVVFKPTIAITTSASTFKSFYQKWQTAGGLRIGPFTIGGGGGSEQRNYNKTSSGTTFVIESTSDVPQILGVYVHKMP